MEHQYQSGVMLTSVSHLRVPLLIHKTFSDAIYTNNGVKSW